MVKKHSFKLFWLIGFVIILIAIFPRCSKAQKTDAFANISITPREGIVRQPFKVTITVYSSTWFAKPLQFKDLAIENAFIIPFTRTLSSISYIRNKKYATLQFYYLVFPYDAGDMHIPQLTITTSIPPEGDYKGKPVTIRSKAQSIEVTPIPSSGDDKVWMVAETVDIKDQWSRSTENLKVGDVLEREIKITAKGTLPSFIQPLNIKEPKFAGLYPKDPILKDIRDNRQANGIRTERYSYLFEKEGNYLIPEEEILWLNPYDKKVYKKTILQKKIIVAPNPDLSIMVSLRDSLQTISSMPALIETKTTPWTHYITSSILALLLILLITKGVILAFLSLKSKHKLYIESEAYSFKQVIKTLKKGDTSNFVRQLYLWYDKTKKTEHSPAIRDALSLNERKVFNKLLKDGFLGESKDFSRVQKKDIITLLKKLKHRNQVSLLNGDKTSEINPT